MHRIISLILIVFISGGMMNLFSIGRSHKKTEITEEITGKSAEGKDVVLYTLVNKNGMTAKITNYGGIITYLTAPDRNGKFADVVLGFAKPQDYVTESYKDGCPFFGALIGRYGNRIAKGEFSLNGIKYKLAKNNGQNHLHGGIKGFDKVIWTVKPFQSVDGPAL